MQIQANPMDDNSIQQSLLADNPNVLQWKPSEGVNRFRRCRSTPSTDPLQGPPEKGSSVKAKELFKEMRPSFRLVGLLLFIYLLVGVLAFYAVMDEISGKRTNRVLDALYFCVVTMTTVGYGDLVPNNDTTKLLACAFVFMGMAVVALFVSKVADYLVEKQEVLFFKALHTNLKGGETKMLRAIETNRIKYKFYTNALLLVLSIISGTVFLWKVEKLSLVDSFYCVCATITTLGYGDKSFSSKLGRVFAVFWIITSTIIMAQFFMYLAEIYTERRQKMLANWVLTRKMTKMDLEAADLDDDRQVGAAEFVVYKLKELGKINQEEISSFLEEFEKLDVDHSGTLSPYDLTLAQSAQ
uniref:EF-hand domain-containing protein n=2 Tax=Oryza nivara TaxID=4536 RepID=A0A0E0GTW5_ORYNI